MSAVSRLIAANSRATDTFALLHPADPTIAVIFRPLDDDGMEAMTMVPKSDDRPTRQAAIALAACCKSIVDLDGIDLPVGDDELRRKTVETAPSIHPDGTTVTFDSGWLATELGMTGEFEPEDVVRRFYPTDHQVRMQSLAVQRKAGARVPNPI